MSAAPREDLLRARSVPELIDLSLRLLGRRPLLFFGLAWRSAVPAVLAVLALDWLVGVHPEWVDGGPFDPMLPLLGAVLAGALCLRGVTLGATALAVEDLLAGRPPTGPVPYLRAAWQRAFVLLRLSGATTALLLASLGVLLIPTLAAGAWLLTAVPFAAVGVEEPAHLRAGHTGRAAALLLLLLTGFAGVLLNLGIGIQVGLYLLAALFDVDIAWWARLLQPEHPFYVDVVVAGAWIVLEPLFHLVASLFAVDLRVRRQGLDLARASDRVLAGARVRKAAVALIVAGALLGGAPRPAQAGEDEEVQAAMQRVYDRPEFSGLDRAAASPGRDWVERFFEWLAELLADLIDREEDAAQEPSSCAAPAAGIGGAWGAGTVGLLLLSVALLALVAIRLASRLHGPPAPAIAELPAPEDGPLERSPEDWRARAVRLADEGALAEALRHLVVGLLVALHRQRLIDFDPSRTNWEYLPALSRRRPGSGRPYSELMRLFDRAWYGAKPTRRSDWDDALDWADAIVDDAGGGHA